MITFTDLAGIPVMFDSETGRFTYDSQLLECDCTKKVSILEVIPGLLNKALRYPETVYEQHCRVREINDAAWPSKLSFDVICIPSGLLGIEYNKTHIFYSKLAEGKAAGVVHVFQGALTVLLQKNQETDDPYGFDVRVEEARIVKVKAGEKATIPTGYFYTFINAGEDAVIFAMVFTSEQLLGYHMLQKVNGMAYYLIAKNARQEIVSNPRYRSTVKVKKTNINELNGKVGYSPVSNSLYREVCETADFFDNLLI